MEFEYNPSKSASNKLKDGIDFDEAKLLWQDLNRVEIPARTTDEVRFIVIGKIQAKHWTAVITYRKGITRIISVRRARKEEKEIHEG